MISLGWWNLIIITLVTLALIQGLKIDKDWQEYQESDFFKHTWTKKILCFLNHPLVKILLLVFLSLLVTRWLIYTGTVAYRLTQPDAPFWDFKQFYIVGKLLLQGLNPYQQDIYSNGQCEIVQECYDGAFIYPPNILPFIIPLGYLSSIEAASSIWVYLHLITIVLILWGATILLESKSRVVTTICIIACALIYGITFDLRVGNISSVVAALIVWCIITAKKDQDATAGILLGISCIKPTISALFFLYFILKRRWTIVGWGLGCSFLLLFIGVSLTGQSFPELIASYKVGYNWTFAHHPSGDPFITPIRIDLGVIGPRFFPDNVTVAKLLSSFLSLSILIVIGQFIYQSNRLSQWSKKISLAEVTLIACLSSLIFYAQRHTTSILVLAVVFLINYLLWAIKHNQLSQKNSILWLTGLFCLSLQTGLLYYRILEPLDPIWKKGQVSYLIKITIGSLPNYTLVCLTIVILILARKMLSISQELSAEAGR
jgi:hypothetical protein